ncbi:zinc finger protein 581 [Anolis carolinensis]|uniref:zinc finger protein 581 n=1 Tax=Anolis carolinensis TaxID=28377 RepID=UPI000203A3F3|nr:PREDICTED: zinc finger protein 581 [Anolis carolinensis]XP_016851548.1 PREDICTED: zinc finger protein 581 [Anolis carolinensis]|eukprot:XP_008115373.1 PREDICTED: zinc finger protein 581 [Anolis carolinensis]
MELQRHSKSVGDPHRSPESVGHPCLQDPPSDVEKPIKLEKASEGEDVQTLPPKLSRPPVPSASSALIQGLNGLPGTGRRAHISGGTVEQGESSRLGRYLLIDSQGLPYTVLVEEGVAAAGSNDSGSVGSLRKVYSCPVCSRTFEYLSYLQRHSITHSESKPHVCRACGKAFKRTSHLERHKYTHSGRKPHQCPICQRSFRDSGELSHHQRVHTGERPYQCEACHMRFGERNTLQRHIRRKHRLQLLPPGIETGLLGDLC